MSGLFANAVASIKIGVQDFKSEEVNRHLSAVRNYYAGILLLAKEVLVRRYPNEDPDKLLASNLKPSAGPNGTIEYVPATQATIDFSTIGRRFKDLGIPFDHSDLKELNQIRNDIEHRFSPLSRQAITEAIAKGFRVTGQLTRLIDENPAVILGDEWQVMLETSELFQAELAECQKTFESLQWFSSVVSQHPLDCPECGSNLVQQQDPTNTDQEQVALSCRACGAVDLELADAIEATLERTFASERYIRFKDAFEEGPVYTCPECLKDTYLDVEGQCANCGFEIESRECAVCGESIPLSDLVFDPDMTLCSYHQHVMDKDD